MNLKRPFFLDLRISGLVKSAFVFGAFVAAFLIFFKPFGLHQLSGSLWAIGFAYGGVTTIVMLALGALRYWLFHLFFQEEVWTIAHELFWNAGNILGIALGNVWISIWFGFLAFSWNALILFLGITLAIGIFPITVATLVKEQKARKTNQEGALKVFNSLQDQPKRQLTEGVNKPILLPSNNKSDQLLLLLKDFLFAQVQDNYVEVVFCKSGKIERRLIRATLTMLEEVFLSHSTIFRCHKSYIINLKQVATVRGNAQGYRLGVKGTNCSIPVSRNYIEELHIRMKQLGPPANG
jgi:hypothetical protein